MTDLGTRYLGLELRTPLVASASPLTGHLDSLHELERAGAAAVVLPSLFEEQLTHEALQLHALLEAGTHAFAEAASYFPELDDYNTGPEHYLSLLEQAKEQLSVPVIASLNATSTGEWVRYARLIEQAGADALELNIYLVAADAGRSGADVELGYLELVQDVRAVLGIPLAVKLSPFFSSIPHMAVRIVEAGADGLVLFNRFYQPDLDLETLTVVPRVNLSDSTELRLPLRWIAILRAQVQASLACTTGVHSASDAAKALLVGADVAMMASALLRHGSGHVAKVEAGLVRWMAEHDYESVDQLRGSVSYHTADDPTAFERANYMRTIMSFPAPSWR